MLMFSSKVQLSEAIASPKSALKYKLKFASFLDENSFAHYTYSVFLGPLAETPLICFTILTCIALELCKYLCFTLF